jgi:hypothetical protein
MKRKRKGRFIMNYNDVYNIITDIYNMSRSIDGAKIEMWLLSASENDSNKGFRLKLITGDYYPIVEVTVCGDSLEVKTFDNKKSKEHAKYLEYDITTLTETVLNRLRQDTTITDKTLVVERNNAWSYTECDTEHVKDEYMIALKEKNFL